MLENKIEYIPREFANTDLGYDDPVARRRLSKISTETDKEHLQPNLNSSASDSQEDLEHAGHTKKSSYNNTVRNSQDLSDREKNVKDEKIYIQDQNIQQQNSMQEPV